MFPVNNDEYPPRPQVYRLGGSSIVGEHSDGENEVVGQSVDGLNNCVFLQYASLCICDISVPLKFWYNIHTNASSSDVNMTSAYILLQRKE
jgi:hypothetical protein